MSSNGTGKVIRTGPFAFHWATSNSCTSTSSHSLSSISSSYKWYEWFHATLALVLTV